MKALMDVLVDRGYTVASHAYTVMATNFHTAVAIHCFDDTPGGYAVFMWRNGQHRFCSHARNVEAAIEFLIKEVF